MLLQPTAWYDASRTDSLTFVGSKISQWDDLTGNGFHLTQSDDALRPLISTSLSVNTISLTAGAVRLANSSINIASPFTVCLSVRQNNVGRFGFWSSHPGGSAFAYQWDSNTWYLSNGIATLSIANVSKIGWQTFSFVVDGSNTRIRINGINAVTGNINIPSLLGFVIGWSNGVGSPAVIGCGEIAIVPRALSDVELLAFEDYCTPKWLTGT
jgi:hypothetical protein